MLQRSHISLKYLYQGGPAPCIYYFWLSYRAWVNFTILPEFDVSV